MGNIFAFLAKYHRFFLFLILEIVCLSLVVSYNKSQRSAFVTLSNEMAGRVYNAYSEVDVYFHLKKVNDSLLAENTRLHNALDKTKYIDTAEPILKVDTIHRQKYVYLPAKVVHNRVTSSANFLTLDIGAKDGAERQAGVVTTAGIAGITRQVSENFTSVLSVLNKDFTVSAEIAEMGEIGSVVWDGRSPSLVVLKDIPMHIRVKEGMHVVTSPYSSIFPQGTPIGVITDIQVKQGDAFYTIYVKLAANMRNIRQVYIIKNLMRLEEEKLETMQEEQ